MKRVEGDFEDANNLARQAGFFREQLEIAENVLIEAASHETVEENELEAMLLKHFENARNTSFRLSLTANDGRRITLTCEMTVEQ